MTTTKFERQNFSTHFRPFQGPAYATDEFVKESLSRGLVSNDAAVSHIGFGCKLTQLLLLKVSRLSF